VSAATKTCDAILKAAGQPTAEASPDAAAGIACDGMWALVAAVQHDGGLTRTGLAAGLDSLGSFSFAYPQGPADFIGPHTLTGGEYWRPDVYDGSCGCFKVLDPTFHPSFS
jgi:hypothetical protein